MQTVLSFDCANQTLGIVLLTFDFTKIVRLNKFLSSYIPDESTILDVVKMANKATHNIVIQKAWLFKLITKGHVRDTPEVERIALLKNVMKFVRAESEALVGPINHVVIEHQMGDLEKSVYSAIVYEFCTPKSGAQILLRFGPGSGLEFKSDESTKCNIVNIHPTYKNSFCFHESLDYTVYLDKYKTLKGANKAHTTENFLFYLNLFQPEFVTSTKKSEINHLADAFMQAYYAISYLLN